MTTSKLPILLALFGGCLLLFSPLLSMPPLVSPVSPAIERPQERLVTAVASIVAEDLDAADAAAVAEFCLVFADVLQADTTGTIANTADLRERLEASSRLMFQQTGIETRHPELAATMNAVLASWLEVEGEDGVRVVDLDTRLRALAVEGFRGIAWGATQ